MPLLPSSPKSLPGHPGVLAWVREMETLCRPAAVHWCDGGEAEKKSLTELAVAAGILIPLNAKRWPGCYLHRSHPGDVARVEERTFICTRTRQEAGPTNHWTAPDAMYQRLHKLCEGGMAGRTMYVVPYLMGPPGSALTKVGVEVTDSIYVALSMGIMTRMGAVAWQHLAQLGKTGTFTKGLHCTLGVDAERRYIAHFPQDNAIISTGSNYGGNVLLGKKCLALRLGSFLGRDEGWMAEHMLILGVESPEGEKAYVAAAFPSACGKTNFAMMVPPKRFRGWKVTTVGDDIAWMRPGTDGRLYAVNPEAGYFGVVPGTNYQSNPNAMISMSRDTIFTNVALTPDGDPWWEGKDGEPPARAIDWKGKPWTPASKEKAAHPNSRFAAPMRNNPALDPGVDRPEGVPISAIVFGGRRATTMPLVFQTFNWIHGVYVGATMGSETTAAAGGQTGVVRRDPMAMLPFCGYNMGDYFTHWLRMRKLLRNPPKIFHVNWFRRDADGDGAFLWPGFGENMRVLKWIVDRCQGRVPALETPLGWMPEAKDIDMKGLTKEDNDRLARSLAIDIEGWKNEVMLQDELFLKLYADLPKELIFQRELLISRL
ncbi:phosphoenolpyruvate carboxykinase (GTP) [Verrucomicrobium sp. GAS474]|uniref:phosphoenolpyruvate carboxykinase (GTP) n=1 Tax=Verrucomicrobium sp. GAS474 TaxID=1882831 RepID=UPI00087B227D|nr:phosphoenolpyruvate carboxykinase (GTP) [Verrucomicrobium sp. GAS474]SDU00343.1 phosphoenolpyruvate carboxykinase (GTP) [Verrucomicrobium sp. GAS474]